MSVNNRIYLLVGIELSNSAMRSLFGEDRDALDDIRVGYFDKINTKDTSVKYIAGGMGDTEYLGRVLLTHTEEDPGIDVLNLSKMVANLEVDLPKIKKDIEAIMALSTDPNQETDWPELILVSVYS